MRRQSLAALVVGFIFALGLGLSGMTRPEKVFAFLNLFGAWNPSLIFVMAGAIFVHAITYRLIRRRPTPLLTKDWHIPKATRLNIPLIVGAFIFGVGWGLGGYCPGPAVTSLASLSLRPVLYVASMVIGMILFQLLDQKFKILK